MALAVVLVRWRRWAGGCLLCLPNCTPSSIDVLPQFSLNDCLSQTRAYNTENPRLSRQHQSSRIIHFILSKHVLLKCFIPAVYVAIIERARQLQWSTNAEHWDSTPYSTPMEL